MGNLYVDDALIFFFVIYVGCAANGKAFLANSDISKVASNYMDKWILAGLLFADRITASP